MTNWIKAIGNFIFTFATVALSLYVAGMPDVVGIALAPAVLHALVAFGAELRDGAVVTAKNKKAAARKMARLITI